MLDAPPRASAPVITIRIAPVFRDGDPRIRGWRAWPDGAPELAVEGATRPEAVGTLVYAAGRHLGIEVLHPLTPAGQTPGR